MLPALHRKAASWLRLGAALLGGGRPAALDALSRTLSSSSVAEAEAKVPRKSHPSEQEGDGAGERRVRQSGGSRRQEARPPSAAALAAGERLGRPQARWGSSDGRGCSSKRHGHGSGSGSKRSTSSGSRKRSSNRQPPLEPLMQAVKACRSCADVLQLVLQEDAKAVAEGCSGVHKYVLANALDSMKKKAAREGGSNEDRQAAAELLQLATGQLGDFGPRGLVAYVRCAAAFKGVLLPEQLAVWQAAALRQKLQLAAWQAAAQPRKLQQASAQDVSNMLLSLGTLAESDERLAEVLASQPLGEQLLQHATELAAAAELGSLQHVANCLYGAALLGLQPTAVQAAALFGAVQLALQQGQYGQKVHIDATQVLLGCAKLTDVQPEAGAAPTPGEDPFLRFYPGAGLVDALLRRATSVPLDPQAVTQLVGACGTLLHMPGQQEGTALLAALREHADNMNAIDACALLVGCARLGARPAPAAIETCVAAVEQEGPSSIRQASNIAWALAVLEACDLPTWRRLTAVAASDIASLLDVHLIQWAQAHQLMQLKHGQATPCPPELLQRSQAAWVAHLQHLQQQQQGKAASRFERLLAAAVAEVAGGHAVQPSHIAAGSSGEPLALVDAALPQLRIAVEADGPHHFLRNRQGSDGQLLPDGPTCARDRLLEGHGWRVIAVPYHQAWSRRMVDGTRPDTELQAGLRRYLEERTGLAAAIAG